MKKQNDELKRMKCEWELAVYVPHKGLLVGSQNLILPLFQGKRLIAGGVTAQLDAASQPPPLLSASRPA